MSCGTPSAETTANQPWSDEEVKALTAIWGEDKMQEDLDGTVRNKVVFVNIERKMEGTTGTGNNVE